MPVSLWTGDHVAVFMPLLLATNRVYVPLLSDLCTQKQGDNMQETYWRGPRRGTGDLHRPHTQTLDTRGVICPEKRQNGSQWASLHTHTDGSV